MQHAASPMRKGIWIASYPKSGNTWVRAFIDNLLREIRGDAAAPQDINLLTRNTVFEINATPYQQLIGKPIAECSLEEIASVRPDVQRLLSQARSRPFFIKSHSSVAQYRGFPTINLEMTLAAIYVVRNPLDVAISFAHHSNLTIDAIIDKMANPAFTSFSSKRCAYEFLGSWSMHVASWMSLWERPIFVMRYEDMLGAPLKVFGALATFLRLAPTHGQLQRAIDQSSFAELSRQERENGFLEKPPVAEKFFRAGTADQWPTVLTKGQIGRVVQAHAPMMQRAGYMLPYCGADILSPSRTKQRDAAQGLPGRAV
jgi:Sulfotransferase domain